jgi:Kef-type K+ transport system membrane component KefB
VGLALGAMIAALVRRELRPTEVWWLLLGSTLLGIGTLTRVGLSAITTTFAMGLALTTLSRHRLELRHALNRTEHAVLLPTLLLAGAHVSLGLPWQGAALAGGAVRPLIAKLFGGAASDPPSGSRGGWILGSVDAVGRAHDDIGPHRLPAAGDDYTWC